jgi:formyl-CoA transferase/succinyl-CoA--D-citramalate CoA-transferase
MGAIGRPELADDPRFRSNRDRADHADELDALIESWTRQHAAADIVRVLEDANVPVGLIYSVTDIVDDPQYQARDMILEEELPDIGRVKMPGLVPKLSRTPGGVAWYGDGPGAHNHQVYAGLLGVSAEELERLSAEGVI